MSGRGQSQANNDNKSGQCNPNNPEYKGYTSGYSGTGTKADRDNHGNQLNPNNERYQPKKWFRGNKPEGILTWKQNWFFYYVNIKKPKSFFLLLFYGNKVLNMYHTKVVVTKPAGYQELKSSVGEPDIWLNLTCFKKIDRVKHFVC